MSARRDRVSLASAVGAGVSSGRGVCCGLYLTGGRPQVGRFVLARVLVPLPDGAVFAYRTWLRVGVMCSPGPLNIFWPSSERRWTGMTGSSSGRRRHTAVACRAVASRAWTGAGVASRSDRHRCRQVVVFRRRPGQASHTLAASTSNTPATESGFSTDHQARPAGRREASAACMRSRPRTRPPVERVGHTWFCKRSAASNAG